MARLFRKVERWVVNLHFNRVGAFTLALLSCLFLAIGQSCRRRESSKPNQPASRVATQDFDGGATIDEIKRIDTRDTGRCSEIASKLLDGLLTQEFREQFHLRVESSDNSFQAIDSVQDPLRKRYLWHSFFRKLPMKCSIKLRIDDRRDIKARHRSLDQQVNDWTGPDDEHPIRWRDVAKDEQMTIIARRDVADSATKDSYCDVFVVAAHSRVSMELSLHGATSGVPFEMLRRLAHFLMSRLVDIDTITVP